MCLLVRLCVSLLEHVFFFACLFELLNGCVLRFGCLCVALFVLGSVCLFVCWFA